MTLRTLRGLLPVALVLALWQVFGDKESVSAPPPSVWWSAFTTIRQSGAWWPALGTTLRLFVTGLTLATALGVLLGGALGASQRLNRALNPVLEFIRATPAAAVVPAALLLFHASARTEVGIIVYGSIWPVLLNTAAGRAALPAIRLEMARSLRLSTGERWRKVVLPSLLPDIVVGIRVAAPVCLIVTLLVDFLVATGGLGYVLVMYQQSFQVSSAFALLATIGGVGIVINLLIGGAERLILRRWPAQRG
ncbi:ABC transporter permease [Actinoplanes subtropicus]|uniref:ABC transporter permease n=1 Tax=Actinoplanes subtropicus TaxID=543632 RepID=UPI000B1F6E76|nr:ABC transporter permease subunit [Actinoplanes subtropicus]